MLRKLPKRIAKKMATSENESVKFAWPFRIPLANRLPVAFVS